MTRYIVLWGFTRKGIHFQADVPARNAAEARLYFRDLFPADHIAGVKTRDSKGRFVG